MSIVLLGIDLGKNSCSVVGLDEDGKVVARRWMRRDGVHYLCLPAGALRDGDGGLLRGPLHGAGTGRAGAWSWRSHDELVP